MIQSERDITSSITNTKRTKLHRNMPNKLSTESNDLVGIYNKCLKTNINFKQSFLDNEMDNGAYPNLLNNINITNLMKFVRNWRLHNNLFHK